MDLVLKATEIINAVMQLVDFENESICFVTADTAFSVIKHYHKEQFFGWNVYARVDLNLILLETYGSKAEAEKVVESIKNALVVGTPCFVLPCN